jgi:hypothetical protein
MLGDSIGRALNLQWNCEFFPATRAEYALPLPVNEPFIEAIGERIRAVSARPGHAVGALASILSVPPDALRRLLEDRDSAIDVAFLLDVVAALVREFAVDPQWLLTGQYDSRTHRHALLLGEDRSETGVTALEAFVREQFQRLRDNLAFAWLPSPERQN